MKLTTKIRKGIDNLHIASTNLDCGARWYSYIGGLNLVVWSYLPSYTLYLSLTATPLFLLVAVAIGLEYMLSTAVSRGCCRAIVAQSVFCSQGVESASECKRVGVSLRGIAM